MAKNLDLSFLLDFYGDVLTEKQRNVMEQYYNDDLSLAEIAENFGITRQGVRDSIKRGESILFDLENKVGFAARHLSIKSKLAHLKALAENIEHRNSTGFAKNEEIAKDAAQILEIVQNLEQ